MKTCLSEGKLTKQFRNPPPLTNPHISEQFFHEPHHCPNFKISDPPPPPLILGGRRKLSTAIVAMQIFGFPVKRVS